MNEQTLQEELEAEFPKHQIGYGVEGGWCICGWMGKTASKHFAEIATRITNARVEGLIRTAAETGFKLRETYGPVEYGAAYPVIKGEEPRRIASFNGGSKAEAEGFIEMFEKKGEKVYLVARQWRRV